MGSHTKMVNNRHRICYYPQAAWTLLLLYIVQKHHALPGGPDLPADVQVLADYRQVQQCLPKINGGNHSTKCVSNRQHIAC